MTHYSDLDETTRAALCLTPTEIRARLEPRLETFASGQDMLQAMVDHMVNDICEGLESGREHVAMIVPVGPVGQYQPFAKACLSRGIPLQRATLIAMDEYLTDDGRWIDAADPLSFRSHLQRNLMDNLPDDRQPRLVVPDPDNIGSVAQTIEESGGIYTTFAGVGITGHLAFNEPIPGVSDAGYFARLPTRVVPLLPETRLINSVTAARGNVARIPRLAITVGMKEILSAERLRIFMNRHWQSAAIRRLAFGPVTADFPASLAQTHPNWSLHAVDHVLDAPEPELA